MDKTKIDWCDSSWNPVTGCLHGCEYCYARSISHRFGGFTELEDTDLDYEKICGSNVVEIDKPLKYLNDKGSVVKSAYPFFFKPTLYRYKLGEPQKWKKGRSIFVCSMADLFGKWVPDSWIEAVFDACRKAPQHNYLFLTKNPERYIELINSTDFFVKSGCNMWFGYSYTGKGSKQWWNPDYNIFASIEPMLEPIDIPRCKWIIVGAETGRRKNKVVPERAWIESLLAECRKYGIPLFMKSSLAEIWGEPLIQEFPDGLKENK